MIILEVFSKLLQPTKRILFNPALVANFHLQVKDSNVVQSSRQFFSPGPGVEHEGFITGYEVAEETKLATFLGKNRT